MPKVVSVIQQALKELNEVHRPDNGLLSASLELSTIKHLEDELLTVESMDGLTLDQAQGHHYIEDNTIAGNSDHMLWLNKELASCKDDPSRAQNPFVMGKLDLKSVE